MRSIGQCLTEDGDILFYGCNVASTEGGKTLISKISEITKADIAASDDVTGKSGDWKLEIKVGHIDTKNINQIDFQHDLAMTRTQTEIIMILNLQEIITLVILVYIRIIILLIIQEHLVQVIIVMLIKFIDLQ